MCVCVCVCACVFLGVLIWLREGFCKVHIGFHGGVVRGYEGCVGRFVGYQAWDSVTACYHMFLFLVTCR